MKKKDIALIVFIAVISAAVSLLVSKAIFVAPKDRQQEVEVVQPISSRLPSADKRYFNDNAIDPTRLITIGQNSNPDPFRATQ